MYGWLQVLPWAEWRECTLAACAGCPLPPPPALLSNDVTSLLLVVVAMDIGFSLSMPANN